MANLYDMYVTNVDIEKSCLKIYGQIEKETPLFIEKLIQQNFKKFEQGHNVPPSNAIQEGSLFLAKYKDGNYYRAKMTKVIGSNAFEVRFIDYGNVEIVPPSSLRFIDAFLNSLLTLQPQAYEFILAEVYCTDSTVALMRREICYTEVKCMQVAAFGHYRLIRVIVNDVDLSKSLVNRTLATPVHLHDQERMLMMPAGPPPGLYRQLSSPQMQVPLQSSPFPHQYKCDKLEVGSRHMVYVSYVSEGPCLFSVQPEKIEDALTKLMLELSKHPLCNFTDAPLEGTVCLARSIEMPEISRAVITNIVDGRFKVFFVDFGNTEILPIDQIYQIPLKFVLPKVMSLRFVLAGIEDVGLNHEMKAMFKNYVQDKLLELEVMPQSNNIPIQRCNLYDRNVNLLDMLRKSASVTYQPALAPARGMQDVKVSFILSCNKFFVQLLNKAESLQDIMSKLNEYCIRAAPPLKNVRVGVPCAAMFSGDEQWYRAQIKNIQHDGILVNFVDFGNEEIVGQQNLRDISPNLVTALRAQALECCLLGYQNMPKNEQLDVLFEALTLEQEFRMKVVESRPNGVLLVDLTDQTGYQVAAKLLEKLAEKQQPSSPSYVTRSPPEDRFQSRGSPRQKKEFFSPSPEKQSWNVSVSSTESHDAHVNNAHNFFKRRDPQQAKKPSPEKSSNWRSSPDKKNSPPKEFRKRTRNDSFESTGRPFDEDNNFNQKDGFRNNRGKGQYGNQRDNNSRGDGNRDGYRSDRSGGGGDGRDNRRGGKDREFRNNKTENSYEQQNGDGDNFGRNKAGGFKKKFDRDQINNDRNRSAAPKHKEPEPDYAPFEVAYTHQNMLAGTTERVSISWFHNPTHWFCQLEKCNAEFRTLMNDIQEAYASRKPESSAPIGASVIAQFDDDKVLYRAKVLEVIGFQCKVLFVDFGNVSVTGKVWKVENKFLNLPCQAVNCGLLGLLPAGESWPQSSAFDAIFNREHFDCYFEVFDEQMIKYTAHLTCDGENIANILIRENLAQSDVPPVKVAEIEEPVGTYLLYKQIVNVRLSYVESLEKICIQLEPFKVDNITATTETLYNNGQLYQLDAPQTEGVCVTKLNPSLWARGIIKEINGNELSILYPDWGSKGIQSLENVYYLPPQLNEWYQSYECVLHDLPNEDDQNKKISWLQTLKQYESKNVIIQVEDVIESRLSVILYDTTSFKPLLDFNAGCESIPLICDFPVLRERSKLWVAYVSTREFTNFPSVFVQASSAADALDSLSNSMSEFYGSETKPTFQAEAGKLCAAISSDGSIYRAQVVKVDDPEESITVQFIDYGNMEALAKSGLHDLDAKFYQPHKLAIELRLDVLPTDNLTNELESLTDREFAAEIFDKNERWHVQLLENDVNPLQELLDRGVLLPAPEEEVVEAKTKDEHGASTVSVIVSHVDSPSEFYLQLVDYSEALDKLQADLQEQVANLPLIESPKEGVICAAPYSLDKQWYRAQVLDVGNDIISVRFIDYGNTDVIENAKTPVRTLLNTELLTIEPYARRCSLELKPTEEEWSSAAIERFQELITIDEEVKAQFVQQSERTAYVKLLAKGIDVAEKLLEDGLACQETSAKKIITGFISHINSASEFWVQLESAVDDLEHISYQLSNAAEFPEVSDLSPGSLCTALFPEDESWYRVRILSNTVAGIEVLFIDYGNSCICNQLRALPEDLIHLPVLAHKCSLKKPKGVESWSEKANEKFKEIANDGATVFTVSNLTPGEISTVSLLINEKDISVELMNDSTDLLPSKDVVDEEADAKRARMTISITHYETAENFWLIKQSNFNAFWQITETLTYAPCWGGIFSTPYPNLVAALYLPHNRWYRAVIIGKENDLEFKVQFVDLGVVDKTMLVRMFRFSWLEKIEHLAIFCKLERKLDAKASEKLHEMLLKTHIEAEFLTKDTIPRCVRLYTNNVNVLDVIETASNGENQTEEVTIAGKDVAEESKAETETVVAEDKTVTSKDEIVTAEDKTLTSKDEIVTVENEFVATEVETIVAEDKTETSKDEIVNAEDATVAAEVKTLAAEDKTVTSKDEIVAVENELVAAEDETVTSKDEIVAVENELVAAEDETVTSKDEIVTAENELVAAEDKTLTSKDEIVTVENELVATEVETIVAEDKTETSKDEIVTAEDETVAAEDKTVTSKDEIVTAETEIVAAAEDKIAVTEDEPAKSSKEGFEDENPETKTDQTNLVKTIIEQMIEENIRNAEEVDVSNIQQETKTDSQESTEVVVEEEDKELQSIVEGNEETSSQGSSNAETSRVLETTTEAENGQQTDSSVKTQSEPETSSDETVTFETTSEEQHIVLDKDSEKTSDNSNNSNLEEIVTNETVENETVAKEDKETDSEDNKTPPSSPEKQPLDLSLKTEEKHKPIMSDKDSAKSIKSESSSENSPVKNTDGATSPHKSGDASC